MSVTVYWDNNDKTILHYVFSGNWTWEEYLHELKQGREMMGSVDHKVCILNDMRESINFPPNFITMARSVISSRPDNTGLAIFLTNSVFFRVLYSVLGQVLPNVPTEYLLAKEESEAYKRLYGWLQEQSVHSGD